METRSPKFSYVPLGSVAAVILLSIALFYQVSRNTVEPGIRMPNKYVLAPGFTGKVRVDYAVFGAPPLQIQNGYRIVPIPPSGLAATSSEMLYGTAPDVFVRPDREGELETLTVQHIKLRKSGLSGDNNEFFESSEELTQRDQMLREQGRLGPDGKPLLGNPYELAIIRDDF